MYGLYIHVPFCASRCIYCDFYSTTLGADVRRRYVAALCAEIEARRDETAGSRLHTIYIGGGTPSQLTIDELAQIVDAVRACHDTATVAETTIEANPDDVTPRWAVAVRRLGFDRVSLGVQTFDDDLLRFLSRRHTAAQACSAVATLREAGFTNLSIDLMYGLPGQTAESWRRDLTTALSLPVAHLSAYSLMFESGTRLTAMRDKGLVSEADEELSLAMFRALEEEAERAGFEHYEISNFARPGRRSLHNASYWDGTPYVGFGPAAHSFDGARRRWNTSDVAAYAAWPGHPPCATEQLTLHDRYDEYVMTRLRTCDGLCPDEIERRFGSAFSLHFRRAAAPHLQAGRLVPAAAGSLRLSREALFVSDAVMSDLMWPDET